MKIAIGFTMQDGPYGGGNSVIRSMANLLPKYGHEIVWTLDDDDIDIIVLVDPRMRSPNIPFAAGSILNYLAFRNPNAIVVQQMHDCDERKNTKNMNRRQRIANYAADHSVCVGSWMLDLDLVRPEHASAYSAVLNGGDMTTFHRNGHTPWDHESPMKLITHHWGGHWMKGFDVYQHLDNFLDDPQWKSRFSMTYIGNVPTDFVFRNIDHLPPTAGEDLAGQLQAHDVYITASINEPAGLHHIEGALCGLPILYRRSGALPEYCDGYGIPFDGVGDIETALKRMIDEYDQWYKSLDDYDQTEAKMVETYAKLFEDLDHQRKAIVAKRNIWRNPILYLVNQVPF
jgi:hypothetical protein